jgi:hypothetical protein
MKHLAGLLLASCLLIDCSVCAQDTSSRKLLIDDDSQPHKVSPKFPLILKLANGTLALEPTLNRQKAQYISIRLANDIAYGLVIAHQNQQIKYGSRMYRRVQTAINLLRKGAGLEGASRRSGVPRPLLDQLMEWGQQRPGALIHDVD